MFTEKNKIIGLLVKVTKQCVRHALRASVIGLAASGGKKKKKRLAIRRKAGELRTRGRHHGADIQAATSETTSRASPPCPNGIQVHREANHNNDAGNARLWFLHKRVRTQQQTVITTPPPQLSLLSSRIR